ncbi:hypothetical protein BH24ACT20_BH24ACT20_00220 [soil metagenome]|jgi:hypothetical protein
MIQISAATLFHALCLQIPTFLSAGLVGLVGPFLAQADYGLFSAVIPALRAIGMGMAGVGLMIAILIKGSAATNADRHALAAQVAERVFAGMFLILLGWFIYDKIVAWTPL